MQVLPAHRVALVAFSSGKAKQIGRSCGEPHHPGWTLCDILDIDFFPVSMSLFFFSVLAASFVVLAVSNRRGACIIVPRGEVVIRSLTPSTST